MKKNICAGIVIGLLGVVIWPKIVTLRPEVKAFLESSTEQPSNAYYSLIGFAFDNVSPQQIGKEIYEKTQRDPAFWTTFKNKRLEFPQLAAECPPNLSCVQSILERRKEIQDLAAKASIWLESYKRLTAPGQQLQSGGRPIMVSDLGVVEAVQRLRLSTLVIAAASGSEKSTLTDFSAEFDFWFQSALHSDDMRMRFFASVSLARVISYWTVAIESMDVPSEQFEADFSFRLGAVLTNLADWSPVFDSFFREQVSALDAVRTTKWWTPIVTSRSRMLNDLFDVTNLTRPVGESMPEDFLKRYSEIEKKLDDFCKQKVAFGIDSSRSLACLGKDYVPMAIAEFYRLRARATLALGFQRALRERAWPDFPQPFMKKNKLTNPFDGSDARFDPRGPALSFTMPPGQHILGTKPETLSLAKNFSLSEVPHVDRSFNCRLSAKPSFVTPGENFRLSWQTASTSPTLDEPGYAHSVDSSGEKIVSLTDTGPHRYRMAIGKLTEGYKSRCAVTVQVGQPIEGLEAQLKVIDKKRSSNAILGTYYLVTILVSVPTPPGGCKNLKEFALNQGWQGPVQTFGSSFFKQAGTRCEAKSALTYGPMGSGTFVAKLFSNSNIENYTSAKSKSLAEAIVEIPDDVEESPKILSGNQNEF